MGNKYRKLSSYEKAAKRFGTPRFNSGEKVKTSLTGESELTINGNAWSNGFTWMYSFENSDMSIGQDYIIPLSPKS